MGKRSKTSNHKRSRSPSKNSRGQTLSPPRKKRKKESRKKEARSTKTQLKSVVKKKRKTDTIQEDTRVSEVSGQTLKVNEEAGVVEQMESELQCSICSELFIRATMLNCSHTFCKYCIDVWNQNQGQCPLCRVKITTLCKNITLDSLIEKIVDNSVEKKQQRIAAIRVRDELEVKYRQNPPASRDIRNGDRGDQSNNPPTLSSSDDWSMTSTSSSGSSISSSSSDDSSQSSTSSSTSSSSDDDRGRGSHRIRSPRPSRQRSRGLCQCRRSCRCHR